MRYSSAIRRSTAPAIGDWVALDLEELPPAVRPAEGQGDGAGIALESVLFAGQALEAAPAVDLEHTGVVGQHLAGTVPDPVLGVDIGHRRRQVALPGAVVPGKR